MNIWYEIRDKQSDIQMMMNNEFHANAQVWDISTGELSSSNVFFLRNLPLSYINNT